MSLNGPTLPYKHIFIRPELADGVTLTRNFVTYSRRWLSSHMFYQQSLMPESIGPGNKSPKQSAYHLNTSIAFLYICLGNDLNFAPSLIIREFVQAFSVEVIQSASCGLSKMCLKDTLARLGTSEWSCSASCLSIAIRWCFMVLRAFCRYFPECHSFKHDISDSFLDKSEV